MAQGCASDLGDCTEPTTVVCELLIIFRDVTIELDDVRILQMKAGPWCESTCSMSASVLEHLVIETVGRAVNAHHEVSGA